MSQNTAYVSQSAPSFNPFVNWTNSQKWWWAFLFALLFFILASNVAYGFTNAIFSGYMCPSPIYSPSGATLVGLILHSVLFLLIVRWVMG